MYRHSPLSINSHTSLLFTPTHLQAQWASVSSAAARGGCDFVCWRSLWSVSWAWMWLVGIAGPLCGGGCLPVFFFVFHLPTEADFFQRSIGRAKFRAPVFL